MSNIVLVSPCACIDPAKPISADVKKGEELQEAALIELIDLIKKGAIGLNQSVGDMPSEKPIDWDNNPYREAFSSVPAICSLSFRSHIGCLEERLEVVRTLVQRGYDVRMLAPTDEFQRYQRSFGLSLAEHLGAKLLDTTENLQQLVDWCRDGQMQVGGRIYNAPDLSDDWFAKLGCNGNRMVSRLGEGGRVVEGDGFVLVSKDTDEATIQSLQKDGLRVYKLPWSTKIRNFYNRKGDVVASAKAEMDHIDLFINTIDAGRLLIVDQQYLAKNPKTIIALAKKEKYEILRVHPSEAYLMPTNFLTLPDGVILMNRAEKLYEQLRTRGLAEHIIMTPSEQHLNSDSMIGGIRCFTNTVKT